MSAAAQTVADLADSIYTDPSVSYWLKTALKALLDRDPVNALNDAELLSKIMQLRLVEAFN